MGCAPLQSFRPAGGLGDARGELGLGGSVQGPRPYVQERAQAAVQLWVARKLGTRWSVSGVGALDHNAFAAGGALRYQIAARGPFTVAVEGELGFLWGATALPLSVRLPGGTLAYTAPRFGTRGLYWALDVPIGLSAPLGHGYFLRGEYAGTWQELRGDSARHLFGMAVAKQF